MLKSKKISIISLLVIIICLILAFTVTASAEGAQIEGGEIVAFRGEQVTMSVTIKDNPGFTYLKVDVKYDADVLTLRSVTNGEVCQDLTSGTYYIWSSGENVTADGVLMTLVFDVKDDAALGNSSVTVECVECSDYNENDVVLNFAPDSFVNVICDHVIDSQMYQASVIDPTCTAMGYTTYICDCGDSYVADYTDPTGHDYTPNVTSPTCTASGYTTYTCDCGESYVADYTDPTGHDYTPVVTAPTCAAMGYTTYTCDCGDSYVADYTDPTGHDYTSNVTAPTCAAMGYTTYTCDCGANYVADYKDAHGHTYIKVLTEPTCCKMGYTTYTCSCGSVFTCDYIDPTGHSFGEWITEKEPTEKEEGLMERECKNNCGLKEDKIIPKIQSKGITIIEIAVISIASGVLLLFVAMLCYIGVIRKIKKQATASEANKE